MTTSTVRPSSPAPPCSTAWNWWARTSARSGGGLRRRRGRHRLPGRDGGPGRQARKHFRVRLQGRDPPRAYRQAGRLKAAFYQQTTTARTLADAVNRADVFLGCSAAGVLTADMVKTMADKPLILALANPEPEIRPNCQGRRARTASSPPAAPTTPTRSTTSCASPISSVARWIAAPPRSPKP